jgi:3',5'-cyclic AMP phosphodiesterase CpdA
MATTGISVIALSLVTAVLAWTTRPAAGEPFHFTVTADPRQHHAEFGGVLAAINSNVGGPGAFHITAGDADLSCAENREQIDEQFGASALWYPVNGNHEIESADMAWMRGEYTTANASTRLPLKLFTNQNGPSGSVETTYSWDYGNAHFISLNEYWNGQPAAGSDIATDGDVVPELRAWLAADLAANTKPAIFVLGHEPAYPKNNHLTDSLNEHPENRDAFWELLKSYGVSAYICGHTHVYSRFQLDDAGPWQIDVGNAGNNTLGDGYSFLDVAVDDSSVTYSLWHDADGAGAGGFVDAQSWSTPILEPASLPLLAIAGLALCRGRRR